MIFEPLLAQPAVPLQPLGDGSVADVHLLGDQLEGETLLEVELNCAQAFVESPPNHFFRRSAPRGGGVLVPLLYRVRCKNVQGLGFADFFDILYLVV